MIDIYARIHHLYNDIADRSSVLKKFFAHMDDLNSVADMAMLLKESANLLDGARKELEKAESVLANVAMLKAASNGDLEIPEGRYAKARIATRSAVKIPSYSRDPEGYKELCEALGLEFNPLSRLHWPTIKEWISEKIANGEQLHPALEKYRVYNESSLVTTIADGNALTADMSTFKE